MITALHQALIASYGGAIVSEPSPHTVLFMANAEIEAGEAEIFGSVGNNSAPDSGVAGAHGLVYDQSAVSKSIAFPNTQTFSHHVRYYFRVDSDNRNVLSVRDGGSTHITLIWRTGGILEVSRAGAVLGTTSSLPLSINTWYEINFYGLIDNSAGEWTLEIDGVIPNRNEGGTMTQTGVDTQNTANAFTNAAVFGEPNLDTYIDDVVISSTNASLGTGQVETLMPTADGNYTQLTPNTGSNHFDRVNEKPSNDETSYVTSSGAAQRDSWAFEDRSVSGTVVAVALFWRARLVSGTPSITPFFRIEGADFDGTAQTLISSGFEYYWEVFDNNPDTGFAWTDDEIDATEVGALCSAANARITQFAMQVYVRAS